MDKIFIFRCFHNLLFNFIINITQPTPKNKYIIEFFTDVWYFRHPNGVCRRVSPKASFSCVSKNRRHPKGYRLFFGADDGICAFSGAPRSDVINVVLCRQLLYSRTTQGKAFCSRKTAPTLKSHLTLVK